MVDPGGGASRQLIAHLRADEPLIWSGRPDPAVRFSRADAFLIPFSILWCGFAIFWVIGASVASGLFGVVGVPFVLVGLYFVFGRFIVKARRKRKTAYGVTPDRVIVVVGTSDLQDVPVRSVPMTVQRSRDGRHASVLFGPQGGQRIIASYYGNTGMEVLSRQVPGSAAFYDVAQPQAMLDALTQARGF